MGHSHSHGNSHSHGAISPIIASTSEGLRATAWSFAILMLTGLLQVYVVYLTGSVALLADTIHNFADAGTAIPLWIAFTLARRAPSKRFTYGLGRVEDLAGIAIVLIIAFSATVAGIQSVQRLIHPTEVKELGALIGAAALGFIGNEVTAVIRLRTGRRINSAALIADGYHAMTDGLTSLAVIAGAIGVYLGYPLADPIAGLIITLLIVRIVWQSAKTVFTRSLDGVESETVGEIEHALEHVEGIVSVDEIRARWIGHTLWAEVVVSAKADLSLKQAQIIALDIENEVKRHLPHLAQVSARVKPIL
ncbi:MAG: cation transporter [Deltaproteobacteria bacterium]|nr:cation transporter [Deltaproteobacteria bacterium]